MILRDTHDSLLSCLVGAPPTRKDVQNENMFFYCFKITFILTFHVNLVQISTGVNRCTAMRYVGNMVGKQSSHDL
jgi:hypothetical protein